MGKNETKNYVGGSGMDDMELDERDIQLMEESRKEGKKEAVYSTWCDRVSSDSSGDILSCQKKI
ncbi:MAG: hypothetical protein ACLSCC_07955 [Coprococcus sp.]